MQGRILIAGGSGAIGKCLTNFLTQRDFKISILSRNKSKADGIDTFYWNIDNNEIDNRCFEGVSYIIQLSGANISEKRWSAKRRKEIVNSRVNSSNLLFQSFKKNGGKIKAFISASAIGYYGAITNEHIYSETDLPGSDFLAQTCVQWEKAADQFISIGVRTVKIRTGIVLMKSYGALAKLSTAVKLGFGAALGSGRQYFPWIHINDLLEIYYKVILDEKMNGSYNAVAPFHTTNKEFIKALCRTLNKPIILPNIPSFVLKIALGDLSQTLLFQSRVSSEKILSSGFEFGFKELERALDNLMTGTQ
jgi:uncharacterized protein (TIGR01777 family)